MKGDGEGTKNEGEETKGDGEEKESGRKALDTA